MKKIMCFFAVLAAPVLVSAASPAAPESNDVSTIISAKLGYDMPGKLNIPVFGGFKDVDVKSGITLGADLIRGRRYIGWGVGLDLLLQRTLDVSPNPAFGFLAVPLTLEFSNYQKYRSGSLAPYLRLQAGPTIFMPSDKFRGSATTDGMRACMGIGFGVRKKQGFVAELMSTADFARLK